MATIWKRKDRDVWVVDYRDATGFRVRLSAATRQHAEGLLADKIRESKHAPTNREDRHITLNEYVTRWLKAAVGQLAPVTHQNYKQHLTLHILPTLGPLRVADLRRRHVKDLLTTIRSTTNAQGRSFAKNSLRLIFAALSSVLTDAVDDEILVANPVIRLGQSKKRSATRMTADDVLTRLRPMTWAQAQTFDHTLSTLHRNNLLDARYALLFFVMAKTGMRPGEALALQPDDLDLAKRTMRVERAATMGGQVKSTKTNEVRTVDLSASLTPKLEAYRNWLELETMGGRWRDSPWLFPDDKGLLYEERHIRRVFHRVLRQANLPTFRPYDLRHTFASLLLSSAVPLLYVSQQLGHANPTTTLKYYARWIPTGDQHYVDVLDTAAEKNLAPNVGTRGERRAEVIDSRPIPSPPTHDDESITTHPRSARRDSWLTPSPAAVRQIDGW
jgi:integrase